MATIEPSEIRKAAEASFAQGLYCAESVVVALARAQGLESDCIVRIATAFCSGMARTRGPCGALTGAVMGLSLALGRAASDESVQGSYAATQRLVREFEQEFGERECHRLLGCDLGTPEGQLEFRARNLRAQCLTYTGRAAETAAAILREASNGRQASPGAQGLT